MLFNPLLLGATLHQWRDGFYFFDTFTIAKMVKTAIFYFYDILMYMVHMSRKVDFESEFKLAKVLC